MVSLREWVRRSFDGLGHDETSGELGDFTTTARVLPISGLAIVVGVLSAFVALVLLRLIGLFTNLFFYGRRAPEGRMLTELVRPKPVLTYADEPLRVVVNRMAETGLTRFPVVERGDQGKLIGTVSPNNLLQARVLYLDAERRRERVLQKPRIYPVPPNGRPPEEHEVAS